MVETHGWALEPVAARPEVDPPMPGYAYTIGFPAAFGFPEVVLFGLTPAASNGLLTLVADVLRGGTEVALGVELVGPHQLHDVERRLAVPRAGGVEQGRPVVELDGSEDAAQPVVE